MGWTSRDQRRRAASTAPAGGGPPVPCLLDRFSYRRALLPQGGGSGQGATAAPLACTRAESWPPASGRRSSCGSIQTQRPPDRRGDRTHPRDRTKGHKPNVADDEPGGAHARAPFQEESASFALFLHQCHQTRPASPRKPGCCLRQRRPSPRSSRACVSQPWARAGRLRASGRLAIPRDARDGRGAECPPARGLKRLQAHPFYRQLQTGDVGPVGAAMKRWAAAERESKIGSGTAYAVGPLARWGHSQWLPALRRRLAEL